MTELLEELQQEHREMSRVLEIIHSQLNTLRSGGPADHGLLRDAAYYMTQYPDLFHHVKEDFVYRRLAQRDRRARDLIWAMQEQHERLRGLGLAFLEQVEDLAGEVLVERSAIEAKGRAYVHAQRQHMKQEETMLFPLLRDTLSDEDWLELAQQLPPGGAPPSLSSTTRQRFRTLFESISQQSG